MNEQNIICHKLQPSQRLCSSALVSIQIQCSNNILSHIPFNTVYHIIKSYQWLSNPIWSVPYWQQVNATSFIFWLISISVETHLSHKIALIYGTHFLNTKNNSKNTREKNIKQLLYVCLQMCYMNYYLNLKA